MQKQLEKLKAEIEIERSKQDDPIAYAAAVERGETLRQQKSDLQIELNELEAVDPERFKEMQVSPMKDALQCQNSSISKADRQHPLVAGGGHHLSRLGQQVAR